MSDRFERVLVTGSRGKIGRLLVEELTTRGFTVSQVPPTLNLAKDRVAFESLCEESQPDVIYHLAGRVRTNDATAQLFDNIFMADVVGGVVAKLPRSTRPIVISLGSAAEIGDPGGLTNSVDEDFHCRPSSGYGRSKLCQSNVLLSYAREFDFRAINARLFNLISLPHDDHLLFNSWANQVKKVKSGELTSLNVGDLDVVRDFLDIREVLDILIKLPDSTRPYDVVNLASGIGTSLRTALQLMQEIAGVTCPVNENSFPEPRQKIMRVVGAVDKLTAMIGRAPAFDLAGSLTTLLECAR